MPRYLLELPGELGEDLAIDLDRRALLAEIGRAIQPVLARAGRDLPALKRSTRERKKRGGYPAEAMRRTGALSRSLRLRQTADGLEVSVDWHLVFHPRFAERYVDLPALDAAVDRAVQRWMARI